MVELANVTDPYPNRNGRMDGIKNFGPGWSWKSDGKRSKTKYLLYNLPELIIFYIFKFKNKN